MNVTLSLDDDLVREVRKIAVERDTTLTGLVRPIFRKLLLSTRNPGASAGKSKRFGRALRR
jgi:hypothetical protein